MTRALCLILAAAGFSTAAAQISYTGGLIFQDFDSLPASGGFRRSTPAWGTCGAPAS